MELGTVLILKELRRGELEARKERGQDRGRQGNREPNLSYAKVWKRRPPYPPSFCKSGAIKELRDKSAVRVVQ